MKTLRADLKLAGELTEFLRFKQLPLPDGSIKLTIRVAGGVT